MLRKINADGITKIIYSSVFFHLDTLHLFTLFILLSLATNDAMRRNAEQSELYIVCFFVHVHAIRYLVHGQWMWFAVWLKHFRVFNGKTFFLINFITPVHFISVHVLWCTAKWMNIWPLTKRCDSEQKLIHCRQSTVRNH